MPHILLIFFYVDYSADSAGGKTNSTSTAGGANGTASSAGGKGKDGKGSGMLHISVNFITLNMYKFNGTILIITDWFFSMADKHQQYHELYLSTASPFVWHLWKNIMEYLAKLVC